MPQLDRDTYNAIIDLLYPLTTSAEERVNLMTGAFAGIEKQPRIDVQGTQDVVVPRIIRKLVEFGMIGENSALWILLHYILESGAIGIQTQERIQALESKINVPALTLGSYAPREKYTEWTRYGIIMLVIAILGLGIAALTIPQINSTLFPTAAPTDIPLPSATPLKGTPFTDDEVGVVVAKFSGNYTQTDAQFNILQVIENAANEVSNVRVIPLDHEIQSSEQAHTEGMIYNATIAIYGRVDAGGVTVNYEILADIEKPDNDIRISAAQVENFDVFLFEGMDTNYILFLTIGQLLLSDEQYDEALERFDDTLRYLPEGREQQVNAEWLYFFRGYIYRELNILDLAIEEITKSLEVDPNFSEGYSELCWLQKEVKQYDNAVRDCTRAIELTDMNTNDCFCIYLTRGYAYERLGRYEEAFSDYNYYIEHNEFSANGYYYRAGAYKRIEQYQEAIDDYTRAIEINSNFAFAYWGRGATYYEMNVEYYEEAIADYEHYAEISGEFEDFMPQYIEEMQQDIIRFEEEITAANIQVENCRESCQFAFYNRAVIYGSYKLYQEAILDYTQAIELDENYATAYHNRGLAYRNLKLYDQALLDYTRAIEIDDKYAYAYWGRGNTYKDLGIEYYEQAIADYERYAELNGDFEPFMVDAIQDMRNELANQSP